MLNQQAAFKKGKPFLKGALHVHTTRSDGTGTPEEVIRLHHENGYQFMALTDHNVINHLNLCPDVPMTMLSGIERDMGMDGPGKDKPICVHVVGIGLPLDPKTPPQDYRPAHYGRGDEGIDAQGMIDEMHNWNLKTFYAHPQWSGTTYQDFKGLRGNFAMEVWNTGCVMDNGLDANAAYWDEALQEGNNMWGVAVDDGHPMHQHCKGWVMVAADNDPASILEALEKGEFYASCGPEIKNFYADDQGNLHLECSPVKAIQFVTLRCPLPEVKDPDGGEITRAQLPRPSDLADLPRYVRATVVDAQGRRAWTNPIILR